MHYSALADLTNDLSYCEMDAVACYDLISISNGDSATLYTNNEDKPIFCDADVSPDMSPDGCSGMTSARSYYGITFKLVCDTHDNCYSNLNSTKSACYANFTIDMEYKCYLELDYGQTNQELCYHSRIAV